MFICTDCLKKEYTNGERIFKSTGMCEICREMKDCSEIQSASLIKKPQYNPKTGELRVIKKRYYLTYLHTAGPNRFFVTTLEELSTAIDRLVEDPHVIQSSVKIETKEY